MEEMCDRILILDGDPARRQRLELALAGLGVQVHTAADAADALVLLQRTPVDVIVCDADLPGVDGFDALPQLHRFQPDAPVVLTRDGDRATLAAEVLRRGAWAGLPRPEAGPEVELVVAQALALCRARRAEAVRKADLVRGVGERPIVAASDDMIALLELLDRTAGYKSTVLLTGERGVGKESIARAMHTQSPRREAPFVVFDCAAHAPDRAEAALFGAMRAEGEAGHGSPRGPLLDAHRGTLYLDGVERLPATAQVALLRTIRTEEIEPPDDGKPVPVDVRVVAASAVDLEAAVEAGRFRGDLFDRLDVVRMRVPPLRARREDLPLLVDHQLARVRNRRGAPIRRVEDEALERLIGHEWPGNVRELELVVERAAMLAESDALELAHIDAALGRGDGGGDAPPGVSGTDASADLALKPARQAFEAQHILRALERTGGNRTHAAKLLRISHRALLYKIKDYGLRD